MAAFTQRRLLLEAVDQSVKEVERLAGKLFDVLKSPDDFSLLDGAIDVDEAVAGLDLDAVIPQLESPNPRDRILMNLDLERSLVRLLGRRLRLFAGAPCSTSSP